MRHIFELSEADLANILRERFAKHLAEHRVSSVTFSVDHGDPGDPRDTGPKVRAKVIMESKT